MSHYLDQLMADCLQAKAAQPVQQFVYHEDLSLPRHKKNLYVIKDLSGDPEATFKAFEKYKSSGERKCPKANEPSPVMYVGSSLGCLPAYAGSGSAVHRCGSTVICINVWQRA